jgi:hypothetical protein
MAHDHIRYDLLAQDALRGVVRTVLRDAAKNGLPGEHHFYVTFDTGAEGVRLSPRMLAQYPQEMTIVLQHQFWDLTVTDDGFEVGLSFGGVPERLVVPFVAIKGFFDPSVQFGLKFEEVGAVAAQPSAGAEQADHEQERRGKRRRADRAAEEQQAEKPPPALASIPTAVDPEPDPGKSSGGGEVVRLDRFRKK